MEITDPVRIEALKRGRYGVRGMCCFGLRGVGSPQTSKEEALEHTNHCPSHGSGPSWEFWNRIEALRYIDNLLSKSLN